VHPAPAGPAKGAQLTDRELIRALRDKIRPADGDPVDKVEVRDDASDVVKFAGIVDDIGAEASRTQQAKRDLREKLEEVVELRNQLASDALDQLSEDESESLRARLRAFEERSGERIVEPARSDPPATEEIAAAGDAGAAEAPPKLSHADVDTRLAEAENRLKDESRALEADEDAIIERADRLSHAGGADDESNVVRLALETAKKIAAERNRAITAQTDRLEAKNAGALANG
jgi:hypothetical protein